MKKIKKCTLIICFGFILLIPYTNETFSAVKFEKGEPSQIRELILKQKQEKKKLLREKYKKKQQEKQKELIAKEKVRTHQKQPTSFTKLNAFLLIGLSLLTTIGITLGFIINYRRQSK